MKKRFNNGDFLRFNRKLDKGKKDPYYCIVVDAFDDWMNVYWIISSNKNGFYQAVDNEGFYGTYEKVA